MFNAPLRAATTNPVGFHPYTTYKKKQGTPNGIPCFLAGVVGFEPTQTVLETGVLPLTPYPYIICIYLRTSGFGK